MSEAKPPETAENRRIETAWKSRAAIEGAGVHLKRAFDNGDGLDLAPFPLLDDFRGDSPELYLPRFPSHPHRGMETITYVLDGQVEHTDSLGNGGVIGAGDVQWMTAGSGIIHQEMPKGELTRPHGRFPALGQPARCSQDERSGLPRGAANHDPGRPASIRRRGAGYSRQCRRHAGPVRDIVTDAEYLDVSLAAGAQFHHEVQDGHSLFAYVIEGEGYFEPERGSASKLDIVCDNGTLVAYARDGKRVTVTTEAKPVRFLLVSGKPLGEPVAWQGPIVMNTQAELQTAFEELQSGAFIKHA